MIAMLNVLLINLHFKVSADVATFTMSSCYCLLIMSLNESPKVPSQSINIGNLLVASIMIGKIKNILLLDPR